jgi:hypothetical protein
MNPPSSNPVCRGSSPALARTANCMRRVYLRLRMPAQIPGFPLPTRSSRWCFVVALLALTGAAACDKMPLTAPSGTAITLIASTNTLPVNGAADITALLIEGGLGANGATTSGSGTPVHNGTVVTFTTTLGRIEPGEAKTTAGKVTVKLVGDGRSGTATITAFSGASSQTLDVNIGAAGATRLVIAASPTSLPATGGTSTITASVQDTQGNGVAGVPVIFTTTRGTLGATNVLTNDQGLASTSLTTTQEAAVTASAGGATAALTNTVTITVRPRTTIEITAPSTATVGVPASFTVTPGATSVIADVVVDFGDGTTPLQLNSVSAARTFSHLFGAIGPNRVTARPTDSEGAVTTASTEVAVAPLAVTLAVTPGAITTQVNAVFTATVPANASIAGYEWNFGNGETRQSAGPQVTYRYPATGSFTASVRVIPSQGPSTTALVPVVVN